jgi:hypothetical protein
MSTTAAGLPPNVATYLAALRAELSDLAPDERDDLLAEVEPSLLEAAADGDEPIAGRLGAPADFAADLRASAGLPPKPSPPRRTGLGERLRALASKPGARRTQAIAHELAPVWWAARAYLAVGLLAIVLGIEWSTLHPAFPRFGGAAGTALVLATALAGSFALGLRHRHARGATRRALVALNAVLLLAAIPVLDRARENPPPVVYTEIVPAPQRPGLVYDDVAVENVYPYDRKGRLLRDVRLYDQLGRPLEALKETVDPERRHVRERNGARAFNAYPIRYFEPGTRRVARPNAGPEIEPRPLRTRPSGR